MAGSGRASAASGHSPATRPADLAIDPAAAGQLDTLAARYVDVIASDDARSPAFRQTLAVIERLGDRDFVATAAVSARVLERGLTTVGADLRAGSPLARRLGELRREAERLDPRGLAPGNRGPEAEARELDRYLEKFSRSQPKLEEILAELSQARFALEQDVAAIAAEQTTLEAELDKLRQFAFLAERLDERLTAQLTPLRGAEAGAGPVEPSAQDVLFAVRRRRGEILTQLALAWQGLAALRLVEASNGEILEAVATAISTTASALRTAVIVAQAVAGQRLALVRLEATRKAAAALTESAAALEAGVMASGGRPEALQEAWADVRAALDRVEARKAHVMEAIATADREISRPAPADR
jgi:uncharacterized protein YaaN involved in tellurite resistance